MNRTILLICVLIVAGCTTTRSSQRPAASANDRVTPSEAEASESYATPSPSAPVSRSDNTYGDGSSAAATDNALPADMPVTTRGDEMNPTYEGTGSTPSSAVPATTKSADSDEARSRAKTGRDTDQRADHADTDHTKADNTGINKRDRKGATLTPLDQGNGQNDTKITQRIRKAVVDDSTLSFTAKNVKIITVNGNVTLRGPVKDSQERSSIEAKAANVAGADRIDNQLEIEK